MPRGERPADRVIGTGLAFEVRIGFHEYERHIRQRVVVDFEAETDWRASARADRPRRGMIDYYEVNRAIAEMAQRRSWRLLEAFCEDVARVICTGFPVRGVRVRATKRPMDMPNAEAVAVECWREPADFEEDAGEPRPPR